MRFPFFITTVRLIYEYLFIGHQCLAGPSVYCLVKV